MRITPIIKITTKQTKFMGKVRTEYSVLKYSTIRETYHTINSFFQEQNAINLKIDLMRGII